MVVHNLKSEENVQEHLFATAINRTRNLNFACGCDHTRYMTRPVVCIDLKVNGWLARTVEIWLRMK